MSTISHNVIINNIAFAGHGQPQVLSPAKLDSFGDKPKKWKPSSDAYGSFKPVNTSSRKETKKSAATQLSEKEELVNAANEVIQMANDELKDSNTRLIDLHDAATEAAKKSRKQNKEAAALLSTNAKLQKKIEGLEKKVQAKTQAADKLNNEIANLKDKKRNADESMRVQKETYADANKTLKDANTLVTNENKQKAATIKKLESELEKLRKEIDKLKTNAADGGGGKRNGNSLEDKMALETHKKGLDAFLKNCMNEKKAEQKNERLKMIASGGGGLFPSGVSGSFTDMLSNVMVSSFCAYISILCTNLITSSL